MPEMPLPKQLSVTGKELVSALVIVPSESSWKECGSSPRWKAPTWLLGVPQLFFSGKIARLDLFGGGQGGIETC